MLDTSDRAEPGKVVPQTNGLRGLISPTIEDSRLISRHVLAAYIPLSFEQQQVWLLDQLLPDTLVCHECVAVHLSGPLAVDTLEQSLNEVIHRHEIWRTSFLVEDGQLMQRIHPALKLTLSIVDLRLLSEAEREAEVQQRAREQAQQRFDLAQGPLVRALLLQLGEEEHYLCMTVHQLICDRVALVQVFLPELHALYDAFSTGQPSPLPPLSLQYADYVDWQQKRLTKDDLAPHLAYWEEHLATAPAGLELPSDRSRSAQPTYRGAMQSFALSKQLSEALQVLSQQEGVSLQVVLAATLQSLLYRYTGQNDLLTGLTTPGCQHGQLQGLLGYFLNPLVLRTNLSGDITFRELLGRVRQVSLEAQAHEIPFEMLVRELQPERTVGVHPLFQVLLTLEPPLPALSGWDMTRMNVQAEISQFDLILHLTPCPEGLTGHFAYNPDLFDVATIARLVGHWQTLLEGIVADAAQMLSELPLLTEKERHQLLVAWNDTATAYPRDRCVHQLIEEQVERIPDAVAVVFGDAQLTYRDLNARANQLAHYLHQLGVGPEVLVGLCVERSLEMVVALLGILKAGGAYVPLDPTYPAERLAFMLEDSHASVLVTQQHLLPQLPAHGAKVVCLDANAVVLGQQSEANLVCEATSDNLAYVIYTSGSTGKPKGVQVLQGAVANFLVSMRQQPGLTAQDTLLAVTTLSFDIAALELFLPLIVGARVIVASRDIVANGAALAETLVPSGATVMQATPVTWRMILAGGWEGNHRLKILCGGEALPHELAQQLLPRSASLWNMYGPTETTIWSTVCKIEPENETVTIGRPIANTQIYLLDTHLQLVPVGVPGELYIGGDGLARGYLNRPDLTAERFIPHPFSHEPGALLYRTGDLARYRPDGTIEHLGRLDHQVKIRGFRIELGEIESVLSQHPAVQQAVVVAREDTPGDKRLVAYVVLHEEQSTTVGDLQSHATKQLPTYMVPSAFVVLEVLPLTPNGKVDRRALPAPEPSRRTMEETYVAPTLPVHHQLVAIWEELLDARPIGIQDNFFHLGGHSLLAAHLVQRIEQVFHKKLSLATLFAGPTIEQLATSLQAQDRDSPYRPVMAIQAGRTRRPFFFLHGQSEEGNAFFCYPLAHDLGTDQPFYVLEPYRLEREPVPPTLEKIAAAHIGALRTVQPEGPYLLGGWCNGALVAYEMARQLHGQGQAVDLLVLMDSMDLVPPARLRWLRSAICRLGNLVRLSPEKQLDWFLRLRHVNKYLRYADYRVSFDAERLENAAPTELGRAELSLSGLKRLFPPIEALRQYLYIFDWVAEGYAPSSRYPGKITFFWHRDEPFSRMGWRQEVEANEIEIHVIPGTHVTILTDHLQELAKRLRICLSEVQAIAH